MNRAIESLGLKLDPVGPGKYLIGLSGGADSTALLLMLLPAAKEGRIRLEAVHVNHGLRGEESDGDERFCTELCRNTGIPLHIYRPDLGEKKDEATARKARFEAYVACCAESGADALMLAHQADDQAETFLMHLLRGAGPDGLECMKSREIINGIPVIRPMLSLRRDSIREALRSEGIRWREDSSNADPVYLRNRIRAELLPQIERFSGSTVEKICHAAFLIGEDNDALNTEAEKALKRLSAGWLLNAEALSCEPAAVRRRVLRMWWKSRIPERKEHALSAEQTGKLDALLFERRGKITLPGGANAIRDGKYLFLRGEKPFPPAPVKVTSSDTVYGSFRLTEDPSGEDPGDGKRTQEVPAGFTRGCVIRSRRPGDRIRPFGCTGSRKLQDYLTDRRIPEPFRDEIPLLCRDGEVLLVGGVGAGDVPRWERSRQNVRLTWHGEMPWMET